MSGIVIQHPSGSQLTLASILAMLVSLLTMGAIVALVALAPGGVPGLLAGAGAILMGALIGLIGGPTGVPLTIISGTLLFLLSGRRLARIEFATGVHRRIYWIGAGAGVGALVWGILHVEEALYGGPVFLESILDPLLYGPAIVTGIVGMLVWHATIVALTRDSSPA